jgi:membrane protease YdiL (CAAX protease family)
MALPVRIFLRLAFALTWSIGGIGLLVGLRLPDCQPLSTSGPLYYAAAYSVSLSGLALTARYAGREGLRRLRQRLIPWRSSPRWYVIVALGYAAITAITLRVASWFRATPPAALPWPVFLGGPLSAMIRDPGPLGEEFGGRGFALPRLLERSALDASLRLGLIHAVWHLPLFFIPGMPQAHASSPLFAVGVVSVAIFDTVLYLHTGANLLLAILVHLMANICGGIALDAPALNLFFATEGIAAVLVVVLGGLRPTGQKVAA